MAAARGPLWSRASTCAGNVISLRCQGQAVGPEVTLGVRSLNFGDTPENEVVVKHFNITNHSWVPAQFQWVGLHPGCGFEFVTPCGEVPGRDKVHKGSLTCTVRFNPQEAMNYYRRCYCLINNQNTLLYVVRPLPLVPPTVSAPVHSVPPFVALGGGRVSWCLLAAANWRPDAAASCWRLMVPELVPATASWLPL